MSTAVWDSSTVTPVGTYKIPVDTSGAGTPSNITIDGLLSYIGSTVGAISVDLYTSSGSPHTWTKDAAAKVVDVYLVGPGGGGASGGVGAASTTKTGGGGGSGGGSVFWSFAASELPSSVTVTVPVSAGGAAVGTAAADGLTPTQPGDTTFGTLLTAKAGLVGTAAGAAGATQNYVNVVRGVAPGQSLAGGGAGTPGANAQTPTFFGGPTGGGGGATVWNSGISYAGGNGAIWVNATTTFPGIAAAAGGTAGTAGTAGQQVGLAGMGGGGGGSSHTGNGGAGGAGGFPGGGGGGGGACWAGFTSGAGGAGGGGVCIVVQRG